ncbi:30S ribosomal protein S9 [Rubinisphaera italica]|uniref:Small ribosomal subunit protein uS9 n=1 Tax=Rubinisphaera italica TaxID=2527969 RepID=A0A5C5XMP6_9PLAN|nr:30S ribosomal protein S9 [Rubinisphaera italica]HBN78930.1 30S ribosomal protein S9 [Planctomycetaceae bacterium]
MSTDQPQEENENTPVEAGDQSAPVSSESTELHDSAEGNVEGVVASTADESAEATEAVETTEDVPQLTLGAESEETADVVEKEYVQPTIRGRIDKFGTAIGTGRRKTSVARVRIKDGSGKFTVNGREMKTFFCIERDQKMVMDPVVAVGEQGKIDIWVRVNGGGITGQTGAVVLGIARALQAKNESFHPTLAEGGFLTRDDRMVERKKYGLAKARKSFQFSKR